MSFMTERYFQMLETHKLYERVGDEKALRTFIEHHVICVWGYSYLLRNIYQELVNGIHPLISQEQKEALRLVSEIILDEEVEEQHDGSLMSHMEVYMEAMQDLGADMGPIVTFFDMQDAGADWQDSLEAAQFSPALMRYAQIIGSFFDRPLHERAAVLFYEGEPYIPDGFLSKLGQLSSRFKTHRLLDYFERHIEGLKRPGFSAAGRLVEIFCGDSDAYNDAAERAAECVMKARIELWNEIATELKVPDQLPDRKGLRLITNVI